VLKFWPKVGGGAQYFLEDTILGFMAFLLTIYKIKSFASREGSPMSSPLSHTTYVYLCLFLGMHKNVDFRKKERIKQTNKQKVAVTLS
jgi:hypothetical protein